MTADTEARIFAAIDAGADGATLAALGEQLDAAQAARDAHLTAPGALAKAARFYAANGLHVFPLRPGGKQPAIPSAHPGNDPLRNVCRGECGQRGHGLYDATTDVDLVDRWWVKAPTANIGLRTGLRFDVIDVDGLAGFRTLRTMTDRGLVPPVLGRASTTRADLGLHLFVAPTAAGNGSNLAPGIDYRGAGGYVVAAPSYRADTGKHWRWTQPLDLAALPTSNAIGES